MRKSFLRIAVLSLGGFLASCGDNIVDPDLPAGAVQFTPPSFYSTWWEMTKSCSGLSGSLSGVTWYEVPPDVSLELDGEFVSAYWSAGSNRIVLSSSAKDNGQVIRHEMLHALLGTKGHARKDFLEDCGGYVSCTSKCVEDAGPAPEVSESVPRVPPSALEVRMTISPNIIRSWENHGYFTVTVQARNTASTPVFVVLPGQSGPPVTFSSQIFGPSGESEAAFGRDPGAASFAPGETKVHAFDFFADFKGGLRGHIFPGHYTLTGAYGGHHAPSQSFQAF